MNVSLYLIKRCLHLFDDAFQNHLEFFSSQNSSADNLFETIFLPEQAVPLFNECEHFVESFFTLGDYLGLAAYLITFGGIGLNAFVLSVLILDNTKTASDLYLMSISLGDISMCLGVVFSQRNYFTDAFTALLGNIMSGLGMYACLTTVMVLTIERFFAIKDPLSTIQSCSKQRSRNVCIVTWVVLLIYCTASSFITLKFPLTDTMDVHVNRQFVSFYSSFVLFYLVPVLVSTVLYTAILRIIQKREKNIRQTGQPICPYSVDTARLSSNCTNNQPKLSGSGPIENQAEASGHISSATGAAAVWSKNKKIVLQSGGGGTQGPNPGVSKQKSKSSNVVMDERVRKLMNLRKMSKMFLVVLVSFVLLMSPHRWLMFVSGIQYKLSGGRGTKGWSLFYQDAMIGIFSLLYLCNSIVDPLVYNIMAKRFRLKLATLVAKVRAKFGNNSNFQNSNGLNRNAQPLRSPTSITPTNGIKVAISTNTFSFSGQAATANNNIPAVQ